MQAVTKVNAEQASKRITQEPTRRKYGEGRSRWGVRANNPVGPAGVLATACRHRGPDATREAPAVIARNAVNWDWSALLRGPAVFRVRTREPFCGSRMR